MIEALIAAFETIEDPRCGWKVEHRSLDILVIAVCAVLGEAESFEDIALYGRCKREWLEGFLALPNGIPSHDTFRRVLMLVDPDAFERSFLDWVPAGTAARPCTWSAPTRPSAGSCWPSVPPRPRAGSWP